MTAIYNKYKDLIPYIFFGVCTTIINIAAYWFCAHKLSISVTASTVLAWLLAVLFAYITNRRWVFHSNARSPEDIYREIFEFFTCRVATALIDIFTMWLLVEKMGINDVAVKSASNVVVVVLNYMASKIIIFRKKESL